MDTTIILENFTTQAYPTATDEEAQVDSSLQSSSHIGSGSSDTKDNGLHPWSIWKIPT